MKYKLTETKFKSPVGLTRHLISRAVCIGAVMLICSSALTENLFVSGSDAGGGKISKFTWDVLQTTFASGLRQPQGLAFDGAGNLFVTDYGSGPIGSVIYKYTPDGVRTLFASALDGPVGLAFDSAGNLFVSDYDSGSIYKLKPNGVRSTFASGLAGPTGLAFDNVGNLFVADYDGSSIYKFTPLGVRSIFVSRLGLIERFLFLAFQPAIPQPPPLRR